MGHMWWELWLYLVLYTQNYMLYIMNDLSQELVNVFFKGQIVKILGVAGHMICLFNFATTAQMANTEYLNE